MESSSKKKPKRYQETQLARIAASHHIHRLIGYPMPNPTTNHSKILSPPSLPPSLPQPQTNNQLYCWLAGGKTKTTNHPTPTHLSWFPSTMFTSIHLLLLLLASALISPAISQSILQILPTHNTHIKHHDSLLYCNSWNFAVETNDAGYWTQVPKICEQFVKDYMTGDRYVSDSAMVSEDSLHFATTVNIAADGKDVWIFDIDETLLSNLPYYALHGYGTEVFNETSFDEWVDLEECPALPVSLKLYKELQQLGFTLILLTGRDESQRNITVTNLLSAGYSDWERLILRGPSDIGTTALVYKSEKRMQLVAEGYRIHGSSGDQWSDLMGSPMARRSFKLPNPMYFIA